LYAKTLAMLRNIPQLKTKSFMSRPPTPFVGNYGYPNVRVGVLAPTEEMGRPFDDPQLWNKEQFTIQKLVGLRSSLVHTHKVSSIKTPKAIAIAQEIAQVKSAPDVEVTLKSLPQIRSQLHSSLAPMGPRAPLENARVVSNVRVTKPIDKIVTDTGIKTNEAFAYLHTQGAEENTHMRLLSVGLLGKKRTLVPTRWAITATDDTLSKQHIAQLRLYNSISDYEVLSGAYLGNHYVVLLLPSSWSYELFETSLRGYKRGRLIPQFSTNYELFEGRKTYATETAGGYYSVRLAVTEYLLQRKRQASVLVLRFITDEYTLPMGVWVTREATRNALNSKPLQFSSRELAIKYLNIIIDRRFGYPAHHLLGRAYIFRNMRKQHSLHQYT